MVIDYTKGRFWNRGNCFIRGHRTRIRWNNTK